MNKKSFEKRPPFSIFSADSVTINDNDCDFASIILSNIDYNSQFEAIKRFLWNNSQKKKEFNEIIDEEKTKISDMSGDRVDFAICEHIARLHSTIYQDAAHSMATVGMLAPFVESLFYQAFQEIKKSNNMQQLKQPSHERWIKDDKEIWDCHFVFHRGSKRKDLVCGIFQLSEAIGMATYFPKKTRPCLEALFRYRNKMFHNGFDWPTDEKLKFKKLILEKKWPENWFRFSTSNNEPWIYYMTEKYIHDCIETIDIIVEAIGKFVKEQVS